MTSALSTAREALGWARGVLPAPCEIEIYLNRGRGRNVIWSEKKCEDIQQAEGSGIGIRVILKNGSGSGRQGYAYTTLSTQESVRKAAQMALDSAQVLPEDPHRKLPSPSPKSAPDVGPLYDDSLFRETIPAISDRLRAGESLLLKKYPLLRSILRASYGEGASESAIVSSSGIEVESRSTHAGLGVSCLAEKDGERQEGGFGLSRCFQKELDWDSIFETASQRTLALLGGRPIPSGTVPVVFDPTVACEFLSLVAGMVCADSVQKDKSPFKGKIGQAVAAPGITLVDDGTLPRGLATSPHDDEGVPTQRTPVISGGILKQFLYDTYTALKDKTASTGNASRAGFRSSPSSGTSNFFLEAGPASREAILKETTGLYLYEVMGLHMADPISGDFSVGAIGSWLEGGRFTRGVRGVTLAGNLIDLLKNIDAVGSDLTFFGSAGSPTFRVGGIAVGGQ